MRRFILGWQRLSLAKQLDARIVNYADDRVMCCTHGAEEALEGMRRVMGKLKLTVNEEKTRTCRVPEETVDFLGYTFGRCYSPKTGRAYWGTKPSKKSSQRLVESIRTETHRGTFQLEATQRVERINRKLTGWATYFCLGSVTQAYRTIDAYTTARLRQWLCGKHQVSGRGTKRYPDQYLYEHLSLIRLPMRTRSLPWAKA
jgi:RNA-directed DNA polymerase